MINNKIDKRLFERIIQKYDKATILNELKKETHRALRESYNNKKSKFNIIKENENLTNKNSEYIGGKLFIKETDFNTLPISSKINISNEYWSELKDEYGYSSSMSFEKIGKDTWKLISIFKPGPIGKPNKEISVNDGIEVSIREILKHNLYKFDKKLHEYDDVYVAIPLHRPDGDMNVLYMYSGGYNFKYDERITLLKLLKNHDRNNDALFKFSTIREDDTVLINICLDNGNKYYLKCDYNEIDDFLKKNSKRVFRNNFNTYF